MHYEIRVKGLLDAHWTDWFEGLGAARRRCIPTWRCMACWPESGTWASHSSP